MEVSVSGFLYQIEDRQKKAMQALTAVRAAHGRANKHNPEVDRIKIIGVAVPTSVHARMEAFLAKHKGDKALPQNKKALALACVIRFLDDAAAGLIRGTPQPTGVLSPPLPEAAGVEETVDEE
jgi:hypothetical protein